MPDLKIDTPETDAPQTQTIVRPIVRPASESRGKPGSAVAGGQRWIAGSALAMLVLLVAAAFVFLPRFAPPPAAPPVAPLSSPPQAEPAPAPPLTQADYLKLAEAMDKAEQARASYTALFESYDKQGAAQWAAEPFAAARTKGEAGRQQFEKREFAAALQSYQEGLASLQQVGDIAKQKEEAAKQALAREEARKAAERAQIAADNFAAAISQGMRLIAQEKAAEARAAFNRAAQIRPGAQEVQAGLAQVAQIEKRRQIAAHRQRAEGFERMERWADALAEYEAALKLDSALEFAAAGRDRVQPLAALASQFEQLLSNPDRLLSAPVREHAHSLIGRGQKISAPGPVLQQQIGNLTVLLAQAETPVRVALESDSATEVAINRVGRLGTFSRREVELLPGNYTVVGTRPGYRDVRRELAVLPGKTTAPLVVRCEESI